MKQEYRAASWLLLLAVFSYAVKYALNIFLARHMSPEFFGDYGVAVRSLVIVGTFILLGTNVTAGRFLSRYIFLNQKKMISHYVGWNIRVLMISVLISMVLLGVFTAVIFIFHALNFKSMGSYHFTVFLLWLSPLVSLMIILASYLKSNNNIYFTYIFQGLANTVLLGIFFLLAVFVLNVPLSQKNIILIFVITLSLLVIVEFLLVFYKLPENTFPASFDRLYKSGMKKSKEWMKISMRLSANSVIFLMITYIDLLIVEMFLPGEKVVGYYAAALTIAGVLYVIPKGIYLLVKPHFSRLIDSQEGRVTLQKMIDRANLFVYLVLGFLLLLIVLFSHQLLGHFGKDYVHAESALLILSAGYSIGTFSVLSATMLILTGHEKFILNVGVCELLLSLIAGISLVYFYGITGAAMAVLLSLFMKTTVLIFYVRKNVPLKMFLWF